MKTIAMTILLAACMVAIAFAGPAPTHLRPVHVVPVSYVTEYTVTAIIPTPVPVYRGYYWTPAPVPAYPPVYAPCPEPTPTPRPIQTCAVARGCMGLLRCPFRLVSGVEWILFGD